MDKERNPIARFSVQCWGCNQSVEYPYSGFEDIQIKLNILRLEGWHRREFGPNASPWFCSKDCATNSYNAKRAEEWWGKKKQSKYFTIIPMMVTIFFVIILCLVVGLQECNFNAGL